MGANLEQKTRTTFAKEVYSWAALRVPDTNFPLDCYWNTNNNSLQPYVHEELGVMRADQLSVQNPPLINTVGMQRNRAILEPWLKHSQPFIVVGPEGCGKTLLLLNAFRNVKGATVSTIHCSAQTDASHVIQRLSESCNVFSTTKGRVLRPKEGDRLILFLKDLNLPRPDKYATIQLIAFLQQLITYKGFYDENLDWVGIERVQIVGSMNPATTVGRHQLSTRFTAIVNVMYMGYPAHDALHAIYSAFLKSVLSIGGAARADDRWKTDGNIRKLASSMVDVYDKVKAKFTVDDYRHYMFNPRDLTEWTFGLLRYELGPPAVAGGVSTVSVQPLFEPWGYECYRLFCDRLVDRESIRKFESILTATLRNDWRYELKLTDVYYSALNSVMLAGAGAAGAAAAAAPDSKADSKTPSSKGDRKGKTESKASSNAGNADGAGASVQISELGAPLERLSSSDFKDRLADALRRYEEEHKNLRMLLFPEILDHLAFEDRVLSRPGGSILLIGDSGVGRRSSITLLSYMHGLEFVSPNMTKNYGLKSFRADLKEWLRAAGVEARKLVLFIEDHQIVDSAFLEDLNSLLSAGEVPGLFGSAQEVDLMLTPLKEEFSQANGNSERRYRNVFEYFTSRVRANLHVVLSMNSAHPQFAMRCESNPAIYNRCTILWMSRWSQEGMKQVLLCHA
jgi:dynein heavy chain 2